MTVLWLLINLWPSIVLICVDFREGGKPVYPEKAGKTLEAQERSTAETLLI